MYNASFLVQGTWACHWWEEGNSGIISSSRSWKQVISQVQFFFLPAKISSLSSFSSTIFFSTLDALSLCKNKHIKGWIDLSFASIIAYVISLASGSMAFQMCINKTVDCHAHCKEYMHWEIVAISCIRNVLSGCIYIALGTAAEQNHYILVLMA